MRTNIKNVVAILFTSLLIVVGLASTASAGGDPTTPATIVAKSSSSNTDEGTVTDSAAVSITAAGVPVVAHIVPDGTPKTEQKKCFRIRRGGVYYTSFKSSSGVTLWKWKAYPAGYRFCKSGKVVIDPNCHNTVQISGPKARSPKGRKPDVFIEVPSFSWQVTATATTAASAKASAEAKCEANGVSASASALGQGYASGSATATASGSSQVEAATAARAAAKAKAASLKFSLEAKALAEASAKASAAAAAEAHCTGAPEQPAPTPAPQLLEIDTINDVLVNNTRTITVVGNTAPSHNGTLFCTAKNGGSITANKTQNVSGSFTKQVTYAAPSEVPSGGKDWVSCTLTQDDGQVVSITTNQFVIMPRPVTPA